MNNYLKLSLILALSASTLTLSAGELNVNADGSIAEPAAATNAAAPAIPEDDATPSEE